MKQIVKKFMLTPKKQVLQFKECQHDPITSIIERDAPLPANIQSHLETVFEWIIKDAQEIREEDKKQEEIDFDAANETAETPDIDEEDFLLDETEPEEEPDGDTLPDEIDPVEKPAPKKRGRPKKKEDPVPTPTVAKPKPKDTGLKAPSQNIVTVPDEGVTGATDGLEKEPAPEEDPVDWSEVPLPVFENSEMPEFKKMEKGHLIWYVNNNERDVLIEDVKWNFNEDLNPDANLQNIRVRALEIAFEYLGISH